MEKKNSNKVLVEILFLLIVGIVIVVLLTKEKELKKFYGYQEEETFYLEEIYHENEAVYSCKTKHCEIISKESNIPIFLIYDNEYLLFYLKTNDIVSLNKTKEEIKEIFMEDIYINILEKENHLKIYNILTNEEIEEKKEIEDIKVEKNYFQINYQDNSYDIYNLLKNKVIKPIGLRSLFLEKYIIFEEKEKWSAYSLEEEKVVLEKSFTKENGFLNILPGKIHTYFYTSYAWDYEEPVEIYNEKLELISENYVPRGKTKEENLIVTKEKEPFITGGISSKSYYRVKDFNMIDSNGLEIYQSKKYLSIQNFVENEEQETEYFLGVDEENILNLYDMKEKLLAKIIEWDENKRLCTTGNMENDIYKFAVSLTSDTSMFYEYNTKTNTLKKEYKEEGVCTK